MKFIYKICLLCGLFPLFFSSCMIGEVVDKDVYASHELVFDYSESALYEMFYSLDLAVKMSAYQFAASDSVQKYLKKTYLASEVIAAEGSGWTVKDKYGEWTFESNNLPIGQKGAVWNLSMVKSTNGETYIPSGDFTITATDSAVWSLSLTDIGSEITDRLRSETTYDDYFTFKSHGTFSVTAVATDSVEPFYYNYVLESGDGGFLPDKVEDGHYNTKVNYSVVSPLNFRYNSSKYLFVNGTLSFDALDMDDNLLESFEATITTVPSDWTVTFK